MVFTSTYTPIFNKPIFSPVAIVPTAPSKKKIFDDVNTAMELASWREFISPNADVALKPNLGWDKLIPGSISAPWVVEAVIIAIRDYVGKIFLVESNQVVVDAEKALRLSRIDEVCRRHNVKWLNMSKGQFKRVLRPENFVLKDINIPEILTRTELITIPVLKTHNKTVVTGAIKNQWGCLEELRHNYHLCLSEALVDVNKIVQPRFAVMDGTVGLEGNGPKSGQPKEMNLILASGNIAGIDATAARIMGFDPLNIPHLRLCSENGFGDISEHLNISGEQPTEIAQPFLPAKHNPVSWLELLLRNSFLEHLIFGTKLLKVFTWGARRYYDLWDFYYGKKIRKYFFNASGYAKQWRDNTQ